MRPYLIPEASAEMKANISKLQRHFQPLLVIGIICGAIGCSGSGDTPTANAPAGKGASGVPVLSKAQLDKLPPEQQTQIQKDQGALQKAAEANRQRRQTGQMPAGG